MDTIKQVERTADGAIITSTIPREYIVQAQTPQGFRCHLLKRAFAEAAADEFVGTDEASLVERAGGRWPSCRARPRISRSRSRGTWNWPSSICSASLRIVFVS